MDVIGMTNLQEAKLAREAEICYVTIALVTDYDCWHESHETVSADMIIGNLQKNVRAAQSIIAQTVQDLNYTRNCQCGEALKYALITDKASIPAEAKKRLECIVGKYLADAIDDFYIRSSYRDMGILVVGSVALDSVKTPSGTRRRMF